MIFKTLKEAENFYFEKFAKNNEDEYGLERWLEEGTKSGDIIIPAQILGKIGGSAKSEKKSTASRENGKLGGRPKKASPPNP